MFAAHLRGPLRAARMRTRLSDFGVLGAAEESLTRQTLIGKQEVNRCSAASCEP